MHWRRCVCVAYKNIRNVVAQVPEPMPWHTTSNFQQQRKARRCVCFVLVLVFVAFDFDMTFASNKKEKLNCSLFTAQTNFIISFNQQCYTICDEWEVATATTVNTHTRTRHAFRGSLNRKRVYGCGCGTRETTWDYILITCRTTREGISQRMREQPKQMKNVVEEKESASFAIKTMTTTTTAANEIV